MKVQQGFTIIEIVLFLAITGALFAGLMIGVNASINQQRYKESVVAYKSVIESQYSQVAYPRNSRTDKWTCNAEGGVAEAPAGGDARGTTRCVLLGRFMQVKDSGTALEVGDVIGIQPSTNIVGAGDVAALLAYEPRLSPVNRETVSVEWQSTLQTTSHRPSAASFLLLRSPVSGLIRGFARAEPLPTVLKDTINEQSASLVIKNCVVPSGIVNVPVQSVSVSTSVASANGITINGNDEQC